MENQWLSNKNKGEEGEYRLTKTRENTEAS
jgi:hypothetical protein